MAESQAGRDRKSTRLNSSHVTTRRYTLFPYTTLFRSELDDAEECGIGAQTLSQIRMQAETGDDGREPGRQRSEEHTSELQSRNDTSLHTLSLHDALPI